MRAGEFVDLSGKGAVVPHSDGVLRSLGSGSTHPMHRRELLRWAGAACLAGSGAAGAQQAPGLAEVARGSARQFGFSVHPRYADQEPVSSLLRQHAGVITPENAMKWRYVETLFGSRDYADADRVAALAAGLGAALRGHTLAWHQSTPSRLTHATAQEFVQEQTAHLQAMTLRYKGRVHTWDVLNEAIDAETAHAKGLRDSVLSRLWGTDRYPALFELARATDSQAKLAYNDYGMEQDEPWCERRRSALLHLLEDWVKRNTPVDVMGLQAHLDLSRQFSASRLVRLFDELRALGLSIQITELDVRDRATQGNLAERDAAVAALYQDFMEACVSHPSVEMVVMWNVTDSDSWVNRWGQAQRRADGQPMRPTLFDSQGQPKAAFSAVLESLRHAKVKFETKETRHV